MKKVPVFFALFLFLFPAALFAQTVKILEVKGDIQVKKEINSIWEKANIFTILGNQAEIKTGAFSQCTLTFDEELKNILTIEENSQIKIENLKPVDIFLVKGKVFSLVEDITKIERFEIKTPIAVIGVPQAGAAIEVSQDCANVKCFEYDVYVRRPGKQRDVTDERIVPGGSGIQLCSNSAFGEKFKLSNTDLSQWEEFAGNADEFRDNIPLQEDTTLD